MTRGTVSRRSDRMSRPATLVVAVMLALGLAGCGGSAPSEPSLVVEAGAGHVHGLGVDPSDGALLLATHAGLFRVADGGTRPERVGNRRRDTMGFTVVGPQRYLASGHPDPREGLPVALGLMRSTDGGRNWRPVSLLGRADLHVLRSAPPYTYAYDAAGGRLLVSTDQGRHWTRRTAPRSVQDAAVDPRNPEQVAISTDDGLFLSPNAGRSWRALPAKARGMLLWTDVLYLVDSHGIVTASADGGRSWVGRGSVGGSPVATASSGPRLLVATDRGKVMTSVDGVRWRQRLALPVTRGAQAARGPAAGQQAGRINPSRPGLMPS